MLNPDAIVAGAKTHHETYLTKETWSNLDVSTKVASIERMRIALSAYLAVAYPVVNSVEELDKLPDGTIVKDSEGEIYIMTPYDEFWRVWGTDRRFSSGAIALPARVIHQPEVKP